MGKPLSKRKAAIGQDRVKVRTYLVVIKQRTISVFAACEIFQAGLPPCEQSGFQGTSFGSSHCGLRFQQGYFKCRKVRRKPRRLRPYSEQLKQLIGIILTPMNRLSILTGYVNHASSIFGPRPRKHDSS